MNLTGPVFTIENECQDCYKCVRHCPCKAIRIVNGKASVIPDGCVACGACVKVCPARAKQIRNDYGRLGALLDSPARVYASIAPSFTGYFGVSIRRLASALKRAGFAGVGETALGAQTVSAKTCEILRSTTEPFLISSACPAAVDYIRKYLSPYGKHIVPVSSPLLAHCRILKNAFGEDIKVVFFGPCAAKKNEADRNPRLLELALPFEDLEKLLYDRGVEIDDSEEAVVPAEAEEGRFYSVEGGMNDTLRENERKVRYVALSGLDHLKAMLSGPVPALSNGRTFFLEVLACPGGCVNGPGMPAHGPSLAELMRADAASVPRTSADRAPSVDITETHTPDPVANGKVEEAELEKALARVGKTSKADELNCGACGYDSCRDFARALAAGKAEEAMCHTWMKQNFQRTSSALIRYIPAGVVIVDDLLLITECNRNFAELAGETVVFDSLGSLKGIEIAALLPDYAELFESVLANGGAIEKYNQPYKDKIINLSVFSVAKGKYAGAVIQDVTKPELQRELIAGKAREVIDKNVRTVQQVARIFGEHIAEAEILLNEIAGSYHRAQGKKSDGQ